MRSKEDVTNVIAALRHHNRVCKIFYSKVVFQDSFLKQFAAIDEPFLALTSLKLFSFGQNVPVLPDSFLGGCAPRLRSLHLVGIPYPSIGKLLLSTTNLVWLSLWRIPHSGYIAPETIVPCLSMLPRLTSLSLEFQHPRSRAHRANRHPLPLTPIIFPNLTFLGFFGDIEYLEDILSRIETPILNESYFGFFNQLVFDTPLLGRFIRRTETFRTIHRARVEFFSWVVGVTLWRREEMAITTGKSYTWRSLANCGIGSILPLYKYWTHFCLSSRLWKALRSQYLVKIVKAKLRLSNGESFYTHSPL